MKKLALTLALAAVCTLTAAPASDEFNSQTLNAGNWTWVDPTGDGSYALTGSNLILTVPGGVSHDVFDGGVNSSVRLLQPLPNTDFQAELRFDSKPAREYQMLGLLVEQNAANYLRFEISSNGSTTNLSALAIENSTQSSLLSVPIAIPGASVWLRVGRAGTAWTLTWSPDGVTYNPGITFTRSLTPGRIGPYAGNYGSAGNDAPAFSASVNYFLSGGSASSPVIPPTALASDDFNSPALNGALWTFVNPAGDGTYALTGSSLVLVAPAGVNHDPLDGGVNRSVRLVQSVPNTDFQVELKFDSKPDRQYQMEGLLVEQDAANYLRFEISSDGSGTFLSALAIANFTQTSPLLAPIAIPGASIWLRVRRAGTAWTLTWSTDGTTYNPGVTFTNSLTPARIGPYAANYSHGQNDAPAFSVVVDSFTESDSSVSDPPSPPSSGSNPASDDFRTLSLDTGRWSFRNPLGGSYRLNGTNLLLIAPGGIAHDPAANGSNYSTRVFQPMANVDFGVEVKFDSIPKQTNTLQGIQVEQDGSNFERFEFQGDNGGTLLFVGGVAGGGSDSPFRTAISTSGSSVWMRVTRTGNTWALSWSPDGTSWQTAVTFTRALNVSGIAIAVGNLGAVGNLTPDFTASVDHFFNLAAPIAPEDGGFPRISNVTAVAAAESASITWNTDENATSRVDFGTSASYGSVTESQGSVTEHSVLLTGLGCAASYSYAVSSVDGSGRARQSGTFSFTTPACPNKSAPLSDSFDGNSLNTSLWAWVDPVGDSYLAFNGTTAQITVAAESLHNAWAPAGNNSARIVQSIVDADFDVAAKFVSDVAWGTTGQGILVEQDALNYLRFEFRFDGGIARIWAGARAGNAEAILLNTPFHGYAPLWLRVSRSGETWSVSWSNDGNVYNPAGTFPYALVASRLGLYATNSSSTLLSTPAFTASVDAFVNVVSPAANPAANKAAPPPFSRIVVDPDPGTVLVQETAGDLDGDGRPDLIAGYRDSNHGIAWYRSPHSGVLTDKWDRFTIVATGECYEDLSVFDVNGDGAKDVVASIDGAVKWYENPAGHGGNPATDLWVAHIIGAIAQGENNFIWVDMDGDGIPDLVTPHSVYFHNGGDSWQEAFYANNFRGLTLLDIGSGKGAINPVGTAPDPPYGFVWYENPRETGGNARTGQWIPHFIGPSYVCEDPPSCFGGGSVANMASGELNGDGREDVVTVQSEGYPVVPPGGIIWWEAPADRRNGQWIKHTIDPVFPSPHNVWVADMDKNGTMDIVTAEQEQSPERRVSIFSNDGTGNFSLQILSNTGSHNPFLIDLNGDGWLDLFSAGHGRFGAPNPLELYINPRGGFRLP